MDINKILKELAKRRPVFHSEHDFKFELAWQIKSGHKNASIRLEYPYRLLGLESDQTQNDRYLDLFVQIDSNRFFIELKYLTAAISTSHKDERYQLAKHGAYPNLSYNVIKDISRVEHSLGKQQTTKENESSAIGFVIVLTNDPIYRTPPGENASYVNFSLYNERELSPEILNWNGQFKAADRCPPIKILGNYQFLWEDYSQIGETERGTFKVLVVPITAGS